MAVSFDSPLASRTSRIILGLTVAMGMVAAVAAAPSEPTALKMQTAARSVTAAVSLNDDGMRPLARGAAIRVGRAYDAEDEDCILVVTPKTDGHGRVQYSRSVTCAN